MRETTYRNVKPVAKHEFIRDIGQFEGLCTLSPNSNCPSSLITWKNSPRLAIMYPYTKFEVEPFTHFFRTITRKISVSFCHSTLYTPPRFSLCNQLSPLIIQVHNNPQPIHIIAHLGPQKNPILPKDWIFTRINRSPSPRITRKLFYVAAAAAAASRNRIYLPGRARSSRRKRARLFLSAHKCEPVESFVKRSW